MGVFFIVGVSVFKLLKKKEVLFFYKLFKFLMIVGLIVGIGVVFSGYM